MNQSSDKALNNTISQMSMLMEFFQNNPKRPIRHPEIVDWVVEEYHKRTGKVFRDPDRGIRKLHQDGYLKKLENGVYLYDPELIKKRELKDFTPAIREQIFKRDNYRCVICGLGRDEGIEIHADHKKPKDRGGKATLENGETLCGKHNYLKKNYKQTETAKRYFIGLYEEAKRLRDKRMIKFCSEVLKVYAENDMNGQIEWIK